MGKGKKKKVRRTDRLSFMDRVKDIFVRDENGHMKDEFWLLMIGIFGLLFFLWVGVAFGVKAANNPKYGIFEVLYYYTVSDWNLFKTFAGEIHMGYLMVAVTCYMFMMLFTWTRMDRYKRVSNNSKGKAKWNDLRLYNPQFVYPKGASVPVEPDEYTDKEPGNMILAKDLYFNIKPNTMVYCNVAVIGTTGTGKTFGYVKPNILQFNCSYVLTDPSGELVHDTGKALMNHGYAVKVFNTAEMQYSARYNPFKYIRTDQDIKTMVKVFMENTDDSEASKGDQFFPKAEEVFYLAICYYIRAYYKDRPDKMNFNTVFEMFLEAQASEENEGLVSPFDQRFLDFANAPLEQVDEDGNIIYEQDANGQWKTDSKGNRIPKPVYELDANGNIRLDDKGNKITKKKYANSPAIKYYKIFKQGSGKTLKSILISAGVRLGFLAIDEVAMLLSADDLELETIGDRRQALFAIIKAEDSTYNFLSAMMFTQLFDSLYYEAGQRNVYSWLLTKGKCTALKSRRWKTSREKEKVRDELIAEQARYKDGAYIVGEEEEDPDRFMEEDENGILPWPKWKIVTRDYKWDPESRQVVRGSVLKVFNGKKEAEIFLDTVCTGTIAEGNKQLTCHVRFILDEFANIGIIPEFDKKLATFRKYNISSDIILQSIDQLRKMYDDNIGLILANCNIMVLLGTTDKEDSEFFSELTGQKTVETVSHSLDNKSITGQSGGNMSVDAENLMRPEDIRTMKSDECLVIVNTQQPFHLKKYWCPDHPNYHELYDDHNPEQINNEFEFKRLFNTAQYTYAPIEVNISAPAPKRSKSSELAKLKEKRDALDAMRSKVNAQEQVISSPNPAPYESGMYKADSRRPYPMDDRYPDMRPSALRERNEERRPGIYDNGRPPMDKNMAARERLRESNIDTERMRETLRKKGSCADGSALSMTSDGKPIDMFCGVLDTGIYD